MFALLCTLIEDFKAFCIYSTKATVQFNNSQGAEGTLSPPPQTILLISCQKAIDFPAGEHGRLEHSGEDVDTCAQLWVSPISPPPSFPQNLC